MLPENFDLFGVSHSRATKVCDTTSAQNGKRSETASEPVASWTFGECRMEPVAVDQVQRSASCKCRAPVACHHALAGTTPKQEGRSWQSAKNQSSGAARPSRSQ